MAKKLALCVGLNYPGTNAALSGCINDMSDWSEALMQRGYEVRTLVEPTKAELVAELKGLVARATYRDRIVFTYSGHGTWLPDRDGDEADGRDEALVCKDYLRGGLLIDDEIQEIFGAARWGVRRLIISDSCHSGSVSRFAGIARVGRSSNARFLPPAEFLSESELARAQAAEQLPARGVPRKGTVLVSGCDDHEYSYDASFDGRPNGAMSYYAIKALESAKNIQDWHRELRAALPSAAYPQSPQLTALKHQRYWSPL